MKHQEQSITVKTEPTLFIKVDPTFLLLQTLYHGPESYIGKNAQENTKQVEQLITIAHNIDSELLKAAWELPRYGALRGGIACLESDEKLSNFLDQLKKSEPFKKILADTNEYAQRVKDNWERNLEITTAHIKDITGFSFSDLEYTVFIGHPNITAGANLSSSILLGSDSLFSNADLVYLWHEILHDDRYLGTSYDTNHAIIELSTDFELRARLNGTPYSDCYGHGQLDPIRNELMPSWKKYLQSEQRDILSYIVDQKKSQP